MRTQDNRPSKVWMASYFKRHPVLSVRTFLAIGKERALVTAANLKLWFGHIKIELGIPATAENATNGFIKSGLFPFNPICSSEKLAPSLTFTNQTPLKSATVPEQLNKSEIAASPPTETEVPPTFTDVSANKLKALKDLTSSTAEWGQMKTEEMWTAYSA
ncbi:hypothetical protein PoB_006025500 [Plakobranchus ocellatus]|uniref:Uncharacterized protein n=1 Tax=Plakobranchus ocellatus TaxID=259542 RepID=A0AAV4CPD6_9GAST|nr:hypothetical protein PoB_006025500 [Plakobranchus ocellatus]